MLDNIDSHLSHVETYDFLRIKLIAGQQNNQTKK